MTGFNHPVPRRHYLSRAAGGLVLTAALLLSACSGPDGDDGIGDVASGTGTASPTTLSPEERRARFEQVMETVTGGADPAEGQLGTFWTEEFEEVFGEELTWVAGFVPFEDTVETGCGPLGGGTAAYCIEDEKIYYDEAWLLALHELLGEPGPVLVLAHEVGHHIAATRGPRPEPVAADIQADCFAGVFFDAAYDGPGLAPGEISGPTAASFVVGARAEPEDSWFAGELKGDPWWRARAFLDGAVGGTEACVAYDGWRYRQVQEVGSWEWLSSRAPEVRRAADGALRVIEGDTTSVVGAAPTPEGASAVDALPEIADAWFATGVTLLGETFAVDLHGPQGSSAAVQGYTYTDADGVDRHGMFLVYVPARGGEAAVVSTSREGEAPAHDDDEAWARIGVPLFVTANGLCPPGGGVPVCVTGD